MISSSLLVFIFSWLQQLLDPSLIALLQDAKKIDHCSPVVSIKYQYTGRAEERVRGGEEPSGGLGYTVASSRMLEKLQPAFYVQRWFDSPVPDW